MDKRNLSIMAIAGLLVSGSNFAARQAEALADGYFLPKKQKTVRR